MSFLAWLQQSPVADWVRTSDYGYYVCLAFHAIGMAVVVGAVLMLAIKVLGFAKDQSYLQFQALFNVAWAGFFLNLVSGLALFSANGENYVKNIPFLLKMSFIVAGGVFQWLLWRTLADDGAVDINPTAGVVSTRAKVLSFITIGCWVFAIMAGRIIAYTLDF